ncbi:methyltransferase domain-containing protein [Nocardioides sp.]|uniref:methyltransferase domain-containing protein n=1 Tax=Nocardioides sp. TaxID=35761 RepID=UPI00286BEACA|nr:methyltransferase domain-containing protein [Nocardioides sp.]
MSEATSILDFPRRYCPTCDRIVKKDFKPGPGGRPDASCPRCRSLERHRFFAILLSVLAPLLDDIDLLLEVSPSPQTTPLLGRLGARTHLKLDLGADNRRVDVLGSLTDVPLADDSVDLLVCYHVLEHIPDDLAAMREIGRVLAPDGLGILQVPFRPGTVTDEDPSADEEERVRRFGQADHVRYYGDDFEDRLASCGLAIQRITPRSLLGGEMATWVRAEPDEMVWLVRPVTGAVVPALLEVAPTALTRTFDAMLGEMTRLQGEVLQARGRLERVRGERDRALAAASGPPSAPAAQPSVSVARRVVRRVRGMRGTSRGRAD